MNINNVLEIAPAKIAHYCEEENKAFAIMNAMHEEYKRERAKKYLSLKVQGLGTIKDIEYTLDCDLELVEIKGKELQAEANYRMWRMRKDRAHDTFEAAMEMGRNLRKEWFSTNDTIKEG